MNLKKSRGTSRTKLIPLLATLMLLGGCYSPPGSLRTTSFDSPYVRKKLADDYWSVTHGLELPVASRPRVAVAEFTVEYVTMKMETPTTTQAVGGIPPVTLLTAAFDLSGATRKQASFDGRLQRELPDELYRLFVAALEERGMEVVSAREVRMSEPYWQFNKEPRVESTPIQHFNPIGNDVGRATAYAAYPASGLQILKAPRHGETEEIEQALLEDLDVDLLLRAKFVVGVYRGQASVERGSAVRVVTRERAGDLKSVRTLVSGSVVINDRAFHAVAGEVSDVDSERYRDALRRIFLPYVAMALEAGSGSG